MIRKNVVYFKVLSHHLRVGERGEKNSAIFAVPDRESKSDIRTAIASVFCSLANCHSGNLTL
jgi:hypothetical protein